MENHYNRAIPRLPDRQSKPPLSIGLICAFPTCMKGKGNHSFTLCSRAPQQHREFSHLWMTTFLCGRAPKSCFINQYRCCFCNILSQSLTLSTKSLSILSKIVFQNVFRSRRRTGTVFVRTSQMHCSCFSELKTRPTQRAEWTKQSSCYTRKMILCICFLR